MRPSSAVQVSLLLGLMVGCFVADATRNRITIRNSNTNFRIDWWDGGRDEPYRVSFWRSGLKSVYTFEDSGSLKTLAVGDTKYTFSTDTEAGSMEVQSSYTGSRMLLASQAEAEVDVASDQRRILDCVDCEETWDNLCGVGIVDVCSQVPSLPSVFNEDAQSSLTTMCSAFGAACETFAFDTCGGQCTEALDSSTAPTRAETLGETDACNPNPCENGGSCSIDPAGGHLCSCASDYGGMACQTNTSSLASFFIEIDYIGTWTAARRAAFHSAADRWSEVITHVPCGGSPENPAGRLLINATLTEIDGPGDDGFNIFGIARPTRVWDTCRTVSYMGEMTFDVYDIAHLEAEGIFDGAILHEMGHVIGIGTLWGPGWGECTTCSQIGDLQTGEPAWTCPAALSAYTDIGGSGADIVEFGFGKGTSCSHLDEDIFDNELMTGFTDPVVYLSKMTAAILDDLKYIVNSSVVDPYTLPSERDAPNGTESGRSMSISYTAVKTMILAVDGNGNVVEEKVGVMMVDGALS